jgi:hypothetical protein
MQQSPEPSAPRDEPSAPAPRTPLTMRQLYGRGLALLGGAIPIGLVAGGMAWLGLVAGVIFILVLATLHDGGWTRKPASARPSTSKRLTSAPPPIAPLSPAPTDDRPAGDRTT